MEEEAYDLEKETIDNQDYRRVVWTGQHQQLVLMSLKPNEAIDMEMHPTVDQFFRVEKGGVTITAKGRSVGVHVAAGAGTNVPAGTWHEVVAGPDGAKLYTIYSPPNHARGHIDKVKPKE
jgi:mannose-6-phosphate isomerase-like protein (cupin superfamily)